MGHESPKAVVSRVLGTSRSSQYYEFKVVDESELEAEIRKVCAQFPCYGYRRVTAELKRRNWHVNRKRIARLMAKLNLQSVCFIRLRIFYSRIVCNLIPQ